MFQLAKQPVHIQEHVHNTLISIIGFLDKIQAVKNGDLMSPDTFERYKTFFEDVSFPEETKILRYTQAISDIINTTYDLVREERKKHIQEKKNAKKNERSAQEAKRATQDSCIQGDS